MASVPYLNMIILLSSSLCIYVIFKLARVLDKLWWNPIRIRKFMASQGIGGPPYRLGYGSTKEILAMRKEAMVKRMTTLSHDIFPKVRPDTCSWINTYGRNYLYWLGPTAQLEITDPDLVRELMINKQKTCPRYSPPQVKKLLGSGIFATEHEKWAKHRKLSTYAFNGESLKGMIPAMIASVETLLEGWKQYESKEIEVYQEFRSLTCNVISRTAFGSNYMEGKKVSDMLEGWASLAQKNILNKLLFPFITWFWSSQEENELQKLMEAIHELVLKIVKRRVEKLRDGEADGIGNDFLGVLVNAYCDLEEDKRISLEDVVDECKAFYNVGHKTTNSLLAWTVMLLAIHPDWQDKARKEVLQIFGQQNPFSDGIAKLKIMGMIINESLRLYPPVLGVLRRATKEVQLGQFMLPADVNVNVTNFALHDSQIWGEDVHVFKPERCLEGVAKATSNNPAAFLPFGLGPHACVGMNFAMMEAKITLSMILQRYSFTLYPTYIHSPVEAITLKPQHGIQVIFHPL